MLTRPQILTGIGHEELNTPHQASSRVRLRVWGSLVCLPRSLGGSLPAISGFSHGFTKAGATGLISFTLAAITSIRLVRKKASNFSFSRIFSWSLRKPVVYPRGSIYYHGVFLIAGYIRVDCLGYNSLSYLM